MKKAKFNGWIARDNNPAEKTLTLGANKPKRYAKKDGTGFWGDWKDFIELPPEIFPEVKWEGEPVEVEVTITKKACPLPSDLTIVEATTAFNHKRVLDLHNAMIEFAAKFNSDATDVDGLMAAGMLVSNFLCEIYYNCNASEIPQEQYDLVFERIKSYADYLLENMPRQKKAETKKAHGKPARKTTLKN